MKQTRGVLLMALFFCYLVVLGWAVLFKLLPPAEILAERLPEPVLNLRPFSMEDTGGDILRFHLREILDNILLFLPMGLYLSLLWKGGKWGEKLLLSLGVSAAFEGAEYALRIGRGDVTDLITNTAGALMGLLLYALAERLLGERTDRVLTALAQVGTVAVLSLLALLYLVNG